MLLSVLGKAAGPEVVTVCCKQCCFMSDFPCGVVVEAGRGGDGVLLLPRLTQDLWLA